jgi:phosphopantothenoylcysteine decarboxylase/phosphopantothenate--cysteine ligase
MLITAGPTHEPIDDVRYIANRSSGKMGLAIAQAAQSAQWDVTVLLGPVAAMPPQAVRAVRFESTAELQSLLGAHFPRCDVLIMAAAVADYRPARKATGKIERTTARLAVELEPTPDLAAACAQSRRPGQRIIGFALEEPEQLRARALEKLRSKGLDAIVANPLETMGADVVSAIVFTAQGTAVEPPDQPLGKEAFAQWLVQWIEGWMGGLGGSCSRSRKVKT